MLKTYCIYVTRGANTYIPRGDRLALRGIYEEDGDRNALGGVLIAHVEG